MSIDLIVRNARLNDGFVDILVAEGKILEVRETGGELPEAAEVVDGSGLTVMASMTDAHTHLRDPGQEYKEDIGSGLRAAAHGGFSNIMCMANTSPVNDTAPITENMLEKARTMHPNGPRLYPIGALTKGLKGKELAPMAELQKAGCVAISNDGMPVENTELFRRALEYSSDWGIPVIDHCEDPWLAPAAGVNEGEVSSRLGLAGQPDIAEALQVGRDILLAEYLDVPVHLAHVSCKKSVDLIRFAKQRGVKVTAETCPHYLMLTDEWLERPESEYSSLGKVNPPLRTSEDVQAVTEALEDGTLDMFATDHAPHADYEKEVEFDAAPCGISGLDTAFSATWMLVKRGIISREAFVRAWITAPCKVFNLPANHFQPGDPADFFLFDPDEEWEVSAGTMFSKSKNTPLLGTILEGRIKTHFLGGKKIV